MIATLCILALAAPTPSVAFPCVECVVIPPGECPSAPQCEFPSASPGGAALAVGATGSYSTLTRAAERRFYRSGGARCVGRRLHLHLPAKTFLDEPAVVRPYGGRAVRYHAYRHRGVTFLVHPGNPYFRQFIRKAKTNHVACVRGRVVRYREPIGVALVVHQMRAIGKRGRSGRRSGRDAAAAVPARPDEHRMHGSDRADGVPGLHRRPRPAPRRARQRARPAVRWIEAISRNATK